MNSKKGFTLVELLAVLVILAVLLVLLIPSVNRIFFTSKETLRDSKIKSIVTAGEKYGNEAINSYQNCVGSSSIDYLSNNCLVSIEKLVELGYIDGEKDTNNIIDPTTNENLSGQVLLCYDSNNIGVYASYVDGENYSCKEIAVNSDNTLNLSSSGGIGYVGGNPVTVKIISTGEFDRFTCESNDNSLAKCEIDSTNKELKLYPQNTYGEANDRGYKEALITVHGDYKDKNNNSARLTKNYSLKVYPTSLNIDESNNNACILSGTTKTIDLIGENFGSLSVTSSNPNILNGTSKNNVLYVEAGNTTGDATLTIENKNGNQTINLTNKVYKFDVSDIPESLVIHKEAVINLNSSNSGALTVTLDNPNIVKFVDSTGSAKDSLTLSEGENSFKIVANSVGSTNITIKGSKCGEVTKNLTVTNLTLKETNAIVYVGGKNFQTQVITDNNVLSCSSANSNAATCTIDGTSLVVTPGSVATDNVDITVRNADGGIGILKVKVLKTSIDLVDQDDKKIEHVCIGKNSDNVDDNKEVYVKGSNLGELSVDELLDESWYLGEANISGNQIVTSKRNIPEGDQFGDYKPGYNTGRISFNIRESNGNQFAPLYYHVYTINSENVPNEVNVGGEISFKVNSSATGTISASSSDESVASVRVSNPSSYNWGTNIENESTVTVRGLKTGTATITVNGDSCGSLTYNITVKGNTFNIHLSKGSYTGSIGATSRSCTTTGSSNSCTVTLPTIRATGEFQVVGWSTQRDSTIPQYQPGDSVTLTAANSGTTFYGNVKDVRKPVCVFDNVPENITKTSNVELMLRCTDSGTGIDRSSEASSISASELTISNSSAASIKSVTFDSFKMESLTGSASSTRVIEVKYKVVIEAKNFGVFNISLNANSTSDVAGNGNESVSSPSIIVGEYTPVEMWEIGKDDRSDVIAILYSNKEVKNLDDGTYTLKIFGTGDMLDFTASNTTGGEWEYSPWYDLYRNSITDVFIEDSVTNVGDYAFYNHANLTNAELSNATKYIGEYAFQYSKISKVTIPASIEQIKNYAFYMERENTESVTSINFADSSNLNTIGDYAFYNHQTTSITIPKSVVTIGKMAFASSDESYTYNTLTNLSFESPPSLELIDNGAFQYHKISDLIIPNSVITIGTKAFAQTSSNSYLKNLTFENDSHLHSIGISAFEYSSLNSISFPASVVNIYRRAFMQNNPTYKVSFADNAKLELIGDHGLYGLSSIESTPILPNSLISIGYLALGTNYNDLESITIGPNVSNISGAIMLGAELRSIKVDAANKHFTSIGGILYNKEVTELVQCPDNYSAVSSSLIIPQTVKTFKVGAFYGHNQQNSYSVTLPSSLEEIKTNASFPNVNYFYISNNSNYETQNGILFSKDLKTLYKFPHAYTNTSYTVPSTVETISEYAGWGQRKIKVITIPSTVKKIGRNAFYVSLYDGEFGEIYLYSDNTIEIENGAFTISTLTPNKVINRTIYVKNEDLRARLQNMYTSSGNITYTINMIS